MGKDAIGVDTHVMYVARSLGWSRALNADQIEKDLQQLFPQSLWRTINPVLVRFGKTHTRKEKEAILNRLREKRKERAS